MWMLIKEKTQKMKSNVNPLQVQKKWSFRNALKKVIHKEKDDIMRFFEFEYYNCNIRSFV